MKAPFERRWQNTNGHRRSIVVEIDDDRDVCVSIEDSSCPSEMWLYVKQKDIPELIEVLQSALAEKEDGT